MVESFRLMRPSGATRTYNCPAAGSALSRRREKTFLGVINGFGYLGALVEITYRVTPISGRPIRVRTVLDKQHDFSALASKLDPSTLSRSDPHSLWAGLYVRGKLNDRAVLIFDSSFTDSRRHKPFPLFDGNNKFRIPAQYGLRVPFIYRTIARRYFNYWKQCQKFDNEHHEFLFFMDSNADARRRAASARIRLSEIQQTFCLPTGTDPQRRLEEWLTLVEGVLLARRIQPLLADVGYLPRDNLPFYLSPTAHDSAFAISYAFATNRLKLRTARAALSEMSEILWNKFGGRVSLVKNVNVRTDTLEQMYAGDVDHFFTLKRHMDPHGILCNSFLERIFPNHCQAAGYRP